MEETVQYSPGCSCKVPAQFTIILPRSAPCNRHSRKHNNKRLYLILLLLLAGDVELNPGPSEIQKKPSVSVTDTRLETGDDDVIRSSCIVCNEPAEPLLLRSRVVTPTLVECSVADCSYHAHLHCLNGRQGDTKASWKCSYHRDGEHCSPPAQPAHRGCIPALHPPTTRPQVRKCGGQGDEQERCSTPERWSPPDQPAYTARDDTSAQHQSTGSLIRTCGSLGNEQERCSGPERGVPTQRGTIPDRWGVP